MFDMTLEVNEIFHSIEGEGKRAGAPAIFLRLQGCPLSCSYCDSMYARDMKGPSPLEYTIDALAEHLFRLSSSTSNRRLTITGGEPLVQAHALACFLERLGDAWDINIETSGARSIHEFWERLERLDGSLPTNIFFTLDYKCPSSGMEAAMHPDNFHSLGHHDVLKFVVGSREDMDAARGVLEKIEFSAPMTIYEQDKNGPYVYFSPVFGAIEPREIVEYIQEHKLDVRLQLQLHKIVWPADMRGV